MCYTKLVFQNKSIKIKNMNQEAYHKTNRENIVNNPSHKMTLALRLQDETQRKIRENRRARGVISMAIEGLDFAYGVEIKEMGERELKQFICDVGTSRRKEPEGQRVATYALLVMEASNYNDNDKFHILSEIIEQQLEQLEKAPDEHKQSFPHKYMLEESLKHLADVNRPEATQKILTVVRYLMTNGYYDKRQERTEHWGCPNKFLGLLWKAGKCLARSFHQNPNSLTTEDLNELLAWQKELSQYPFCKESATHLAFSPTA